MPRNYDDYLSPPEERGGGWIFIILIGLSVVALVLGSGWYASRSLSDQPLAAEPTQVAAPAAQPSTVPSQATIAMPTPTPVVPQSANWRLPNGHFYTETNDRTPLTSAKGFAVADDDGIQFWAEFQRLGGTAVVGYPLSNRFQWNGLVTQLFQRAIFQWDPDGQMVQIVNVMDWLHDSGQDDWLARRGVPSSLPPEFDRGKSASRARSDRLSLLALDPAIQSFYRAAPDPEAIYGLPSSLLADLGDYVAIRFQRGVLQRWKEDKPWANAGQVTAANVGEFAKEVGVFPRESLLPVEPSRLPEPTERALGNES